MPVISGSYSKMTPYCCNAGKHFSSEPLAECVSCAIAARAEVHPCITGRHFYKSRYDAGLSICCKPYIIDAPALVKKIELEEARLPDLVKRVDEITPKLQKFEALKSDLENLIAAKKAARSEIIAKAEQPSGDLELMAAQEDIQAVEGHIRRERSALEEATIAIAECRQAIGSAKRDLGHADRHDRRNAIHARMTDLLDEWNRLVSQIIELRVEAGLKLEDGSMNGPGAYPIFPPGFVETRQKLAPIFFLNPGVNIFPEDIHKRRAERQER